MHKRAQVYSSSQGKVSLTTPQLSDLSWVGYLIPMANYEKEVGQLPKLENVQKTGLSMYSESGTLKIECPHFRFELNRST